MPLSSTIWILEPLLHPLLLLQLIHQVQNLTEMRGRMYRIPSLHKDYSQFPENQVPFHSDNTPESQIEKNHTTVRNYPFQHY